LLAIIFANGQLNIPKTFNFLETLKRADLLIAANGGSHSFLDLGIRPHFVIGDLDSLSKEDLALLEGEGMKILRYPKRKDYTDLELALQFALDQGAQEVQILGALGNRWDHTIANFLLPAIISPATTELENKLIDNTVVKKSKLPRISFVDGDQQIFFMQGEDQLEILGQPGDTVSLVPLTERVFGVSTTSLEYPLSGEDLLIGRTLTISNVLLNQSGWVSIKDGRMLCVVIHASV